MPEVLPEALRICIAVGPALLCAQGAHGLDVMIHAMMFEQPLPRAGMAGRQGRLGVHYAADVDDKPWRNGPPHQVLAFDSVTIIHMRNLVQRRRLSPVAKEIGYGCRKGGGAGERARHLMVQHVVGWAVREDKRRPNGAEQPRDTLEGPSTAKNLQVTPLQA